MIAQREICCQKQAPGNGPIKGVNPLPDGVLQIILETGSVLKIPLAPHVQEARLRPLRDRSVWNYVDTNARFVHRYRDGLEVVELGWDELLSIALGPRWV